MAHFRKHGSGWKAEIERRGVRANRTFETKAAAVAWAGSKEAEIMAGHRGEIPNLTVADILTRYSREVSEHKKGKRWEQIRLKALGRDPLASVKLRQLDTPHPAAWQERRLKVISSASVRRERNLLNNAFEIARKEWRWLAKNPFEGVRRPKDGKPRRRIATKAEIATLTAPDGALTKVILWALETGMRASEIASPPTVSGRVATLIDSKNGEPREVPLSKMALKVWTDGGFGLTAGSISALFAQRCTAFGIEGLTFHDLRATAATRLSSGNPPKLNPLQLARMFGWRDLKQAMTYYRESSADVAKLL